LRSLVDRQTTFGPARNGLGQIARRCGDRIAAPEHFRAASEHDPSNLWSAYEVATKLRELGRLEEAEAILQSLVDRQPTFAPAGNALGQIALRRGDRIAALEHSRAAA
jgi:predicted Zn-dependent protease